MYIGMILAFLCLFRVMKVLTRRRWNRTYFCGHALMSWNRARRNRASDTSLSQRIILPVDAKSCNLRRSWCHPNLFPNLLNLPMSLWLFM